MRAAAAEEEGNDAKARASWVTRGLAGELKPAGGPVLGCLSFAPQRVSAWVLNAGRCPPSLKRGSQTDP